MRENHRSRCSNGRPQGSDPLPRGCRRGVAGVRARESIGCGHNVGTRGADGLACGHKRGTGEGQEARHPPSLYGFPPITSGASERPSGVPMDGLAGGRLPEVARVRAEPWEWKTSTSLRPYVRQPRPVERDSGTFTAANQTWTSHRAGEEALNPSLLSSGLFPPAYSPLRPSRGWR
jgi:hypothetical protein